jgi:hypothetical protein
MLTFCNLISYSLVKSCASLLQQIQLIYYIPVFYNFFDLQTLWLFFVCWWSSLKFSFMCTSKIKEYYYKVISATMYSIFAWISGNALNCTLRDCLNPSLPIGGFSLVKYFSVADMLWLLKTSSTNDLTRDLFVDKDIWCPHFK